VIRLQAMTAAQIKDQEQMQDLIRKLKILFFFCTAVHRSAQAYQRAVS